MKRSELIMNWKWQRLRFSAKFLCCICTHKLEIRKGHTEIISGEDKGASEETLEETEPGGFSSLENLWHSVLG